MADNTLPESREASSVKHTSGPWRVGSKSADDCSVYAGTTNVAFARQDYNLLTWQQAHANAHLIASAPDMLEALRDMLSGWSYIREMHGDLSGVGWDRAETAARAAIAKATGDTQ